jgi:hypothetical protein
MSYQLDIIEDMCQQLDDNISIHIYLHEIDLTNQARSFFDLFADAGACLLAYRQIAGADGTVSMSEGEIRHGIRRIGR